MRRFFLLSGLIFLFLVLPEQVSTRLTSSLHGQQRNRSIAYAATPDPNATTTPQTELPCPTTSQNISSKQPLLNFCSPIYQGLAAGPYRAHITLQGENLAETPGRWFLSQGKQIENRTDEQNCISHSDPACYILPEPTQTKPQPQITLFAWTWKDNFPTIQGMYYITAIFSLPEKQITILSTSNSFQLLTSQAPCLSLNNDHCTFSTQTHQLKINASKPLIVHGENWILQPHQTSTTEQIQLQASCIKNEKCSQNTAIGFVPSGLIKNGAFTISWPLPKNLQGSYHISATNLVSPITNTENSDTVANQTLSFGTADDGGGFDITILPLPASPINIIPFNIIALFAMLPALIGIFAFLILWGKKIVFTPKLQSIQSIHVLFAPTHQSSSITTPALPNTPYKHIENLEHRQIIASFPLQIANLQALPQGKKDPDLDKHIRQAIKLARNQKEPQEAIYLAAHLLRVNLVYWEDLRNKLSAPFDVSSEQLEQWEQLGIQATSTIQNEANPNQTREYCSAVLVYYTLYLSYQTPISIKDAHIHFDMGYAYLHLAMLGSKNTIPQLLKKAQEHYEKALRIYSNFAQSRLVARTRIALGDVQSLHAACYSSHDPNVTRYYENARQRYQSAEEIYRKKNTIQDIELEHAIEARKNKYKQIY